MTFMRAELAPWLIAAFALAVPWALWRERRFHRWVEAHWFLRRSWVGVLGSWAWWGGLALLCVVLLDPRLGEIKIKGKVRKDRTIILVDTSSSMLAEDVKPNRLEKATLLAKHFVRKAPGHEISVMVFADITKKLVPFTNDRDLLDARIDSVRGLRNLNAGSSIGLALEEAVRHFDPADKDVTGNILVITDGEDNAGTERFKLPEGISLAMVGVGTKAGAPIPMKDSMGFHHGVKKERGVTILTKLNEGFFKAAVDGKANARYFLAQSYDLPTDQIVAFFGQRKAEEEEGDNLVRPVAMEGFALPGLVLLALGFLARNLRPFAALLALFLLPAGAMAQDKGKEGEIPPQLLERMEQLRRGELDRLERINLADQLVKAKAHEEARQIYRENLSRADAGEHPDSFFNWATSELEGGDVPAALDKYHALDRALEGQAPDSPLRGQIRDNVKRAVLASPEDEKKKQDKKNTGDGEGKERKPEDGEGDSRRKDDQGESTGKDSEDGKNPFDPDNQDNPEEGEGEEKKEAGDKEGPEKRPLPAEEGKDGKPKPKPSPLLEQLKQDDRKLQLKLLDTSTQKRVPGRRKDW